MGNGWLLRAGLSIETDNKEAPEIVRSHGTQYLAHGGEDKLHLSKPTKVCNFTRFYKL